MLPPNYFFLLYFDDSAKSSDFLVNRENVKTNFGTFWVDHRSSETVILGNKQMTRQNWAYEPGIAAGSSNLENQSLSRAKNSLLDLRKCLFSSSF